MPRYGIKKGGPRFAHKLKVFFMRRCSTAIQTQWQEQFPAVHTSILRCLRVDRHEEPFNLHLDEAPQLMLFRSMSDVKIC